MSTEWKILRDEVLIANLALTDIDMTGTQTEPAAPNTITFAFPDFKYPDSGNNTSEYAFVVHAYNNAGTSIAGTADVKVVERADLQRSQLRPARGDELRLTTLVTNEALEPINARVNVAVEKLLKPAVAA